MTARTVDVGDRAWTARAGGGRIRGAGPLVLVLVVAAALRVVAAAGQPSRRYLDTKGYLAVLDEPLTSLDFWAGERPFGLPLLYRLVPATDAWRVAAQVGVAVVCWSALAVVAWRCIRDARVRWAVVLAVLGLSLTPPILQWDPLLISESLTLSLTAATGAAWLAFARSSSRGAAIAVVLTSAAWVFTRDSAAYLALLLVPVGVGLVWAHRVRNPRPLLLVCGLVAACGALSLASTNTDQARLRRWERPLLHALGERVIPDPEARAWFEERGMPVTPELLAVAPRLGHVPAPPAFERWVRDEGRSLYARYLATHPWSTVTEVVDERDEVLDRIPSGYHQEDAPGFFPRPLEHVLFPPVYEVVVAALVLVGSAAWRLRRRGTLDPAVVVVVMVGIGLQVVHAALAVHGDGIELRRHALGASVATRVLLVLLAAAVADAAIASRRRVEVAA